MVSLCFFLAARFLLSKELSFENIYKLVLEIKTEILKIVKSFNWMLESLVWNKEKVKESGVESLCGCKAAPIQCNPPDETDHCTITNTKNTEIQRQIHKYFSRSNAIRLMKHAIAQILTQIQTNIRGQIQRSRVSLLFETGLQQPKFSHSALNLIVCFLGSYSFLSNLPK